jgi:hypothetical protein
LLYFAQSLSINTRKERLQGEWKDYPLHSTPSTLIGQRLREFADFMKKLHFKKPGLVTTDRTEAHSADDLTKRFP